MRKALLVVTLIAASFAGGAAMNGPGLKWVKTLIGNRLRQGDAIPTVAIDAPPAQVEAGPDGPAAPIEDVPSVPPPPLTTAATRPATAEPAPAAAPEPAPTSTPAVAEAPPVADPPADAPVAEAPAPAPADPAAPAEAAKTPEGWADAPGAAPAVAVLPTPRPVPGPTGDASVAAASADAPAPALALAPTDPPDWSALRKRMRAMGVARYWVEGTPSGAVTFRCTVPVPGQVAVSQQFEAEAEDDLRAAEVALRRAALWQAAQRLRRD